MSRCPNKLAFASICILIAALAAFPGIKSSAAAGQLSAQDIVRALKPTHITRGLTATHAATEETRFIDTLRNRPTRSLTSIERDKIATISQSKRHVDLEINFELDSAVIASTGLQQATALGEAVGSPELSGSTFVLAGHTDARGSEAYNKDLSERRADAVKQFLTEHYAIDAKNLVTVGYGKTLMKNSANPFAAENRRVQIVNVLGDE